MLKKCHRSLVSSFFKALSLGFIRNGSDLTAHLIESFRSPELLGKAFQLFLAEGTEVLTRTIADKKRSENDIHNLSVLTINRSVRFHSVEFAFLVTDNCDLFLVRVEGFDVSLDGTL